MRVVVSLTAIGLASMAQVAEAAWVLYDDFSSGRIRTSLWAITGQGTQANILVENGKLVFERIPGATGLAFASIPGNRRPQDIKGIRVDVTASECNGDLTGSVQTKLGNDQKLKPISSTVRIRPGANMIDGFFTKERYTEDGEYDGAIRNTLSYNLSQGRNFTNKKKTITVTWSNSSARVTVSSEGGLVHTFRRRLRALDTFAFHALGATGEVRSGECRLTFDNVYVNR